jgi:hypothetical protein
VVAVKRMAAPAGGGDRVAEREVLKRAGSCVVVVVCLLKRPKTLVAGIAAAGQGRLGPTRLIQGSIFCLSLGGGAQDGRAETKGADCSRDAGTAAA